MGEVRIRPKFRENEGKYRPSSVKNQRFLPPSPEGKVYAYGAKQQFFILIHRSLGAVEQIADAGAEGGCFGSIGGAFGVDPLRRGILRIF